MAPRGRLLALEGIDGCGKSTQAQALASALGARLTHEPGATPLGADLRRLLLAPDSAQLHAGARVVVTGKLAPSTIATHCMQGKPFEVATSEILGPN